VETWYEAALLRENCALISGPAEGRERYLLVDGNVTVFKEGQVKTNVRK